MNSELTQILLQALTAMAWADGTIDPRQESLLRDLYREEQVPEELSRRWLESPVSFPSTKQLALQLPEGSDRLDLVTELLHMCMTDRRLDPREAALFRLLGEEFGVDQEVVAELERRAQTP